MVVKVLWIFEGSIEEARMLQDGRRKRKGSEKSSRGH